MSKNKSSTSDIRIRIDAIQKEQLWNIAQANGHKTLSDYVRSRIFDKDLAIHQKLDEVLKILRQQQK